MSVKSANFSLKMGMKTFGLAVTTVPNGFIFNVWDFLDDQREKILCVASANLMNLLTIIK